MAEKPASRPVPRSPAGIELVAPELIHAQLTKMKPEMEAALPKHMNPDRMARIALTVLRENPTLFECTKDSFMGCLMKASALGLEPGVMGQCYFVPFWNNQVKAKIATFIPGWKGLLDLVKRTERASATSRGIFDGDEYDYAFGDRPFIHHKPGPRYGEQDALIMTYAVGWTHGAEYPEIDVWSMERIWKHRDAQMKRTGAKAHYSYEHPEMYARKIPLLQVIKYLPTSIELMTAQTLEGQAETGTQRISFLESVGTPALEADVQEAKIAQRMQELDWDEKKRNDFQASYAGRAGDALDYLEAEIAKRGKGAPADGAITIKGSDKAGAAHAGPQGASSNQATQEPDEVRQAQGKVLGKVTAATAPMGEAAVAVGGSPDKPAAERAPSAPAKSKSAGFWE